VVVVVAVVVVVVAVVVVVVAVVVVVVAVVVVVVVVVSWTRRRHQHLSRGTGGVRHSTHEQCAVGAAAARRKYTKKVCTADVAGSEGSEAACVSVREGVRVDMCRPARALGIRVRWEAVLIAVHARLEAMVLRARRGTHQGSVDTPAGMQRKGDGLKNHGMQPWGDCKTAGD
jgi:hypothetical protein